MHIEQQYEPQRLIVDRIDYLNPNVAVFTFRSPDGGALPPMIPGQYLSLQSRVGASFAARPYSICSSPNDARQGIYQLALERYDGGFFPNHIHATLKVGDEVYARGPVGYSVYNPETDAPHVLYLSGGSAITPYLSALRAIDQGDADFTATLLFGSATRAEILFRDELDRLAQNPKITVVHVLSDEVADGYAHGYLTAELVRKYAPADGEYSLFLCGPPAMYAFVDGEIPKLGLPAARVHHELYAVPRNLADMPDYTGDPSAVYTLTVEDGNVLFTLPLRADEPVLTALDRGGVRTKQLCHSGECGFCEAKLVSGEIYTPQFGFSDKREPVTRGALHPCCSFPLGDLHIAL